MAGCWHSRRSQRRQRTRTRSGTNLAVLRDSGSKFHTQIPQNAMEVFRLAVAGWTAEKEGKKAEAVHDLCESASLQDHLGLSYNTIKPMREMLADLLWMN